MSRNPLTDDELYTTFLTVARCGSMTGAGDKIMVKNAWQPMETAPKNGNTFLALTSYGEPCTMKYNGKKFVRTVTCRRCDGFGLGHLVYWTDIPEFPITINLGIA